MLYDYDLIIVGASPAGYMAALSSTQDNKDLKVAIFDKKKSVDDNIHPSNSFYSGMFSILNENVDKSYILHEIDGMKLISPSGNKLTLNNKGWAIDKKKFDNFYYSKSVKSNISIFFECEIVDIQINKEFVLINVKTNTIYEKYTSKLIIIADGINSSSSKILGINTVKYPEDIAWGIEANIKYDQIGTSKYAEYYFGSHAPGWKSTYLPMSSDNASVGIYIRRNRKNLEKYFYKWLLRFANIKNIDPKDIEIKSLKQGGDPIVTIPHKIYDKRILIAGGAAGQSGIGYGMFAGKIAGEVASKAIIRNSFDKKVLSEYNKQWRKYLYVEHLLGRFSLELLRNTDDIKIDYIFSLLENKNINLFFKNNILKTSFSLASYLIKKDPLILFKLIF